MPKSLIALILQICGLVCATVAGAIVAPALGFAVAAVSLILVGLSVERS